MNCSVNRSRNSISFYIYRSLSFSASSSLFCLSLTRFSFSASWSTNLSLLFFVLHVSSTFHTLRPNRTKIWFLFYLSIINIPKARCDVGLLHTNYRAIAADVRNGYRHMSTAAHYTICSRMCQRFSPHFFVCVFCSLRLFLGGWLCWHGIQRRSK